MPVAGVGVKARPAGYARRPLEVSMSLPERVNQELKAAMLARDSARLTGWRLIKAAFLELEKSGKGEVTDERCVEVLRRMKNQREESIQQYVAGGREELAEQERLELAIIEGLLPQLADEATTVGWVREAIAASGATSPRDMGKAMGALMKAHKSDIDGALARRLLEQVLAGAAG
jgi:uncharacterized protein YqeY